MKYVAEKTITRAGKRVITKGDVLTQVQVDKKKVSQYVSEQVTRRTPWTVGEVELVSYLYHTHSQGGPVLHQEVADLFMEEYTTHPRPGVLMMVNQIRSYDNHCEVEGLETTSPYLLPALKEIDSVRYSG